MARIKHETFEIAGAKGGVIRTDVRLPDGDSTCPVVIVCHGFKGFKNWGFFPFLSEQLAEAGIAAVNVNFSHNGVGPDLETISELELFKKNTLTLEIDDLNQVLNAVVDRSLPLAERFDCGSIGLIGHSRGGSAVVCTAAEREEVSSAATLASIARPPAVSAEEEDLWRSEGVHYVLNSRTGQQLPLGVGLLDDMRANSDRIQHSVQKLNKPLLILHGADDPTVPVSAAVEIDSWAPNSTLKILEGADHTFGVTHPFKGSTAHFDRVVDSLKQFFS